MAKRTSKTNSARRPAKRATRGDAPFQEGLQRIKYGYAQCAEVAASLYSDLPRVVRKVHRASVKHLKKMHKALNAPPSKPARSSMRRHSR